MANFLLSNKALIKARFRAQIESASDGAHDSSDFFASLVRRIDHRLASGEIDRDAAELLQQLYLETMMDHARAHGRARSVREFGFEPHDDESRSAPLRSDEAGFASDTSREGGDPSLSVHFRDGGRPLSDQDEQIIRLRAAGLSHKAVAHVLGLRPATVRQRWSRLLRAQSEIDDAMALDRDEGETRRLAS